MPSAVTLICPAVVLSRVNVSVLVKAGSPVNRTVTLLLFASRRLSESVTYAAHLLTSPGVLPVEPGAQNGVSVEAGDSLLTMKRRPLREAVYNAPFQFL